VRFSTDFYNRFIAPPGLMLDTRMADWLNRSGPFRAVIQPGVAPATPFVLEAVVTDLYGDFLVRRPCATSLSTAVEARRVRTLSARLVSTIGTRVPMTMPALSALAKDTPTSRWR
jgi:hypothetical protein